MEFRRMRFASAFTLLWRTRSIQASPRSRLWRSTTRSPISCCFFRCCFHKAYSSTIGRGWWLHSCCSSRPFSRPLGRRFMRGLRETAIVFPRGRVVPLRQSPKGNKGLTHDDLTVLSGKCNHFRSPLFAKNHLLAADRLRSHDAVG